jgi:hypothetical protein
MVKLGDGKDEKEAPAAAVGGRTALLGSKQLAIILVISVCFHPTLASSWKISSYFSLFRPGSASTAAGSRCEGVGPGEAW